MSREDTFNKLGLIMKPDDISDNDTIVAFDDLFPNVIVKQGPGKSLLIVEDNDKACISWALLDWYSSDGDGDNPRYEVLAFGNGTRGLREFRHTYFGDDGYVFYLNGAVLAWGIAQLGQWFDWH